MALKIDGLDRVIKKINKIKEIDTLPMVMDVADMVRKEIRAEASMFSQDQYKCIAEVAVRNYTFSTFIDVGLKNDIAPFEDWRGLWFQHWGFYHELTGKSVTMHRGWFDNALNGCDEMAKLMLNEKLRKEVRKAID